MILVPGTSATLAELPRLLFVSNPLSTVWASFQRQSSDARDDGAADGRRRATALIASASGSSQVLPGYTFERAPGESWRVTVRPEPSRHRCQQWAPGLRLRGVSPLKLRYLARLYAKERVMHNFVGLPADQLLERMVELSLRTEEHL